MLHKNRIWSVEHVDDPDVLGEKLTNWTGCGCCGFSLNAAVGAYLFLNDSTSADGAQEFAVVKVVPDGEVNEYHQIESITFGWCTYEKALELIRRTLAGEFDRSPLADYERRERSVIRPTQITTPKQHGRCHLCA